MRAVGDVRVPGKRPRGKPRGRWEDCVRRDMQALRITPEDDQDRSFWKSRIRAADPTYWEKAKKKKDIYFIIHYLFIFLARFISLTSKKLLQF